MIYILNWAKESPRQVCLVRIAMSLHLHALHCRPDSPLRLLFALSCNEALQLTMSSVIPFLFVIRVSLHT